MSNSANSTLRSAAIAEEMRVQAEASAKWKLNIGERTQRGYAIESDSRESDSRADCCPKFGIAIARFSVSGTTKRFVPELELR